jgi:hypothetical protein
MGSKLKVKKSVLYGSGGGEQCRCGGSLKGWEVIYSGRMVWRLEGMWERSYNMSLSIVPQVTL